MATKKTEGQEVTEATEKMVKIRLPKTKENQADVFVGINDRTWLIKRGETVEVPECVQEVLMHQEEMLETILEFEEANAQK